MNKLETVLLIIIVAIIVLGTLGALIAFGALHPLICKVYTWDHPDGKVVRCLKVGSDVRNGGQPEPNATATDIVYPTLTPTEWEPWSTSTPTPTEKPYPVETVTPGEPYPFTR